MNKEERNNMDALRASITERAFEDLVKGYIKQGNGKLSFEPGMSPKEIEEFFRSEWGYFISFGHGEIIITEAKRKAAEYLLILSRTE